LPRGTVQVCSRTTLSGNDTRVTKRDGGRTSNQYRSTARAAIAPESKATRRAVKFSPSTGSPDERNEIYATVERSVAAGSDRPCGAASWTAPSRGCYAGATTETAVVPARTPVSYLPGALTSRCQCRRPPTKVEGACDGDVPAGKEECRTVKHLLRKLQHRPSRDRNRREVEDVGDRRIEAESRWVEVGDTGRRNVQGAIGACRAATERLVLTEAASSETEQETEQERRAETCAPKALERHVDLLAPVQLENRLVGQK
jgi:hypothetical protein